MKYAIEVVEKTKHTVDIDPIDILHKLTMQGLMITSTDMERIYGVKCMHGRVVEDKGEVKVLALISQGYSCGHYESEDKYSYLPVADELSHKAELLKAVITIEEWWEGKQ